MGILDTAFGGKSGRNAAIWQAGVLGDARDLGVGSLTTGRSQSLADLGAGEKVARRDLRTGLTGSLAALKSGFAPAKAHLDTAQGYWKPLATTANAGYGAYADASGAAGQEGNDRATANFRAGPGYKFAVDESTDQAARAAAAAGMAASGNTMQAVSDRAGHMADQEYQQYVQNLAPYLNLAPQIAGQQADIEKDLSGLYSAYGQNRASLFSDNGKTLASLGSGMAANRAGVNTGFGQNVAALTASTGNKISDAGGGGLMAGQQGSVNAINAGLGLANLGANIAGKVKNPFA